ncbi:hypothetical protein KA344_15585 [bacterium]|nr:hypothetical protein [bacterium]
MESKTKRDAYEVIEQAWLKLRNGKYFSGQGVGEVFYETESDIAPVKFGVAVEFRQPVELSVDISNSTPPARDFNAKLLPNSLLVRQAGESASNLYSPKRISFDKRFTAATYTSFLDLWYFLAGRDDEEGLYRGRHRFLLEDEKKTAHLQIVQALREKFDWSDDRYFWLVGSNIYKSEQFLVIDKSDYALVGFAQRTFVDKLPGWLKLVPTNPFQKKGPFFESETYYSCYLALPAHQLKG